MNAIQISWLEELSPLKIPCTPTKIESVLVMSDCNWHSNWLWSNLKKKIKFILACRGLNDICLRAVQTMKTKKNRINWIMLKSKRVKKIRRIFKMRNFARSYDEDGERCPLTGPSPPSDRNRSPSIDSISTNSSSSSQPIQLRQTRRNYGSFLPNYISLLRNSLRRSTSSQVRHTHKNTRSFDRASI